MPFVEDIKTISGNLIIDGTLESKHIKTDSIEANKFKGATQEQYFYKFNDITVPFSSYTTLHEFEIPPTELDLIKGREIQIDWDFSISTGTSSTVGNAVYVYIEVLVPEDTPSFRLIGLANHVSFPVSGWQRMYLQGNYLNRFGVGQVGSLSTYKAYRNLTYEHNYPLTELLTNGLFNGVSNWTAVGGVLASYQGTYAEIQQDSNSDRAYFYQEVSVDAGHTYQLQATMQSLSTAGGLVHLSTSSDIEDAFYTSAQFASGATTSITRLVDIDVDTVYMIGEVDSTTLGDKSYFDNFSLKKTEPRTFVDISTSSGSFSTTDAVNIYHHPFGSASGGTYALVKQKIKSIRTNPYTTYCNMTATAYLGIERIPLICRVRARHFYFGDTITTTDGAIRVISRMTGEQHES